MEEVDEEGRGKRRREEKGGEKKESRGEGRG